MEINFSSDSTAIVLSGLDEVNLFQAKEQKDNLVSEMISVIALPNNEGEKETLIEGKIIVKGNQLIFEPQTPFKKGRSYAIYTLLNSSFGKTKDVIKADMGHTIKAHEKILQR